MVDAKKPSIEEILAACRKDDGGEGASSPKPAAEESPQSASPTPAKAPEKGSADTWTVSEMLAAARAEKAGGNAAEAAPEKESAPKKAAPAGDPRKMSVADMLAAARGGGAGATSEKKVAKKKPAAASVKKKAPVAASSAAKAAPADTSSILAAARAGKRGPVSKAAAEGKGGASKPGGVSKPVKKKVVAPPMPDRPTFRRSQPTPVDAGDRRGFFLVLSGFLFGSYWATGLTSLAVTHLLWVLGLARFMFPNVLTEPPTVFKVGFPSDLGSGQVQTKFKAQFGVWIVQSEYEGQLQIYALKSVCTHLGCTPNWLEAEQKFKCPCHGSGFYKDGVNFEGPAPRPLERYAIRVSDDGQLEVDKSQTFQEEVGQWADPACYVAV